MIRITINQAAFDAIALTLPLGSVAYEQKPTLMASGKSGLPRTSSIACGRFAGLAKATAMSFCGWRQRRRGLDATTGQYDFPMTSGERDNGRNSNADQAVRDTRNCFHALESFHQ